MCFPVLLRAGRSGDYHPPLVTIHVLTVAIVFSRFATIGRSCWWDALGLTSLTTPPFFDGWEERPCPHALQAPLLTYPTSPFSLPRTAPTTLLTCLTTMYIRTT